MSVEFEHSTDLLAAAALAAAAAALAAALAAAALAAAAGTTTAAAGTSAADAATAAAICQERCIFTYKGLCLLSNAVFLHVLN